MEVTSGSDLSVDDKLYCITIVSAQFFFFFLMDPAPPEFSPFPPPAPFPIGGRGLLGSAAPPAGQAQRERAALALAGEVELGREPAPAAAERLAGPPPFPPAACWWARITVEIGRAHV